MTHNPLSGPRIDRSHVDARNGIPLSAANARAILADIESQVRNPARRRAQAAFFTTNARNVTEEARAVYAAYAAGGELVA